MQESRGMGGAAARLRVEDFFSSRLKALTKLSSARKSWLGQIRRKKIFYSSLDSTVCTYKASKLLYNYWYYITQHTEIGLKEEFKTKEAHMITNVLCLIGLRNIHGDWKWGTTVCILSWKLMLLLSNEVKVHLSRVVRLWIKTNII